MVCPLDWGIGHATRCIPIINHLNQSGHEVILAASGSGKVLLQQYFPQLKMIDFPSVQVRYSRGKHLWIKLFLQMPRFLISIFREHFILQRLIKENHIDAVISDNRFGCWSKNVPSVYITHQVNLISPLPGNFLSSILAWLHHQIIRKYHACWIPDLYDDLAGGFAGCLSHPPLRHSNWRYLGVLSRFSKSAYQATHQDTYNLAILSGPEPQRSLFEQKIMKELTGRPLKIIRGLPGKTCDSPPFPNIDWYNHAEDDFFEQLVLQASNIICRSGYSTIMDLVALGRTAHLIPTPGQSEQEYLAKHLSAKGFFTAQKQSEPLKLPEFTDNSVNFGLFSDDLSSYVRVVDEWLQGL